MSSKKFGKQFRKGLQEYRVSSEFSSQVIEEYLSALDCPRALTVLILYRNMEHEQLAKLEFNPHSYASVFECRDAYAATKFLSKFQGLTLDYDLDEVAFTKFREFEALCRQTNDRFRDLSTDPQFTGSVVWLHNAVIRKIDKILGDFDAEEFFSSPDWGPGASTLIKRRDASPVKKFQCEIGITRGLHDLLPLSMLREVYPLWASQLHLAGFPAFQGGNKVITVPKDSTTNRVIAIEPGINLFFQKSVGNMIRRRLRRFGLDLSSQSCNQSLALKGSLSNLLATIDLSSASDSISCRIVEELIPPRWFHLMDSCRSRFGVMADQVLEWEKFSSMGNGFTFELESLIFYAVALCCAEYKHVSTTDVGTYGDDIVIPSVCYELFGKMMDFYGFRLNGKKSHLDSPFRESCGSHYYAGVDVKPIFLKERLTSVLTIYRLANAVRRQARTRGFDLGCDTRLRSTFELLVHKVPKALRLRIPDGLGDGGFIANFDEATPSRARDGIEGYHFSHVAEISKTYQDVSEGYLLASLWSLADIDLVETPWRYWLGRLLLPLQLTVEEKSRVKLKAIVGNDRFTLERSNRKAARNSVPLSGRVSIRLTKGLTQQWSDLGPWV
jgi:hypothetical protein